MPPSTNHSSPDSSSQTSAFVDAFSIQSREYTGKIRKAFYSRQHFPKFLAVSMVTSGMLGWLFVDAGVRYRHAQRIVSAATCFYFPLSVAPWCGSLKCWDWCDWHVNYCFFLTLTFSKREAEKRWSPSIKGIRRNNSYTSIQYYSNDGNWETLRSGLLFLCSYLFKTWVKDY